MFLWFDSYSAKNLHNMKGLMNAIATICLVFAVCCSTNAQNKDIDKGRELLEKAFAQKEPQKKMEFIQKASELFTKGGMKREQNLIIGDAFLEHDDLVQASNYYGRCDKNEKKDGLRRVADAYTEKAFDTDDVKVEAKMVKNAVNFYNKSGAIKEGASGIGDRYFSRGEAGYSKALEYYFLATDTPAAEKVANALLAKGGESAEKAIDLYKQIGSKNSLRKAGDLSFAKNDYEKALDFYSMIDYTEGMRKCADKFNEVGKTSEAQNVYVKMAESYMKFANTDAVEKLATDNVNAMNYQLAAKIYDKAGNLNLANKYYAYYKFMELDLDSAKMLLTNNGEMDLVKAIDMNMKPLNNLRSDELTLMDFVQNQPYVAMENDPATGKLKPVVKDENILIDYYKGIKDAIVGTFHSISRNVQTVSHPELKKMMIKHFKDYPAASKILDPTFNIRLQKATAQVKDVYLK